jgi:hypothetical protein
MKPTYKKTLLPVDNYEDDEEGEIQFIGNDPYVVDPSAFQFRTDCLHKLNWRSLSRLNLNALQTPQDIATLTSIFNQHIQDLAYCDLVDEMKHGPSYLSHEGL